MNNIIYAIGIIFLAIVGIGVFTMPSESTFINPAPSSLTGGNSISELSIYLGLESGYRLVDKFGKNEDVDTSFEQIWRQGDTMVLLDTASTMTVTSSGQDTNGGTGARTFTIQGLNGTYHEIEETITLNSSTPVITDESFIRINRAYVVESGSNLTNENTIIITASVGGSVQGNIQPNEGQTAKTQYTIPTGYTGYLISGYMATDSGQHTVGQLLTRDYEGSWRLKHETVLLDGVDRFDLEGTSLLPEKSDITWQAKADTNNNEVVAGYHLILVENN